MGEGWKFRTVVHSEPGIARMKATPYVPVADDHVPQVLYLRKPINVHQQVRGSTCDDLSCRTTALKRQLAIRFEEQQRRQQAMHPASGSFAAAGVGTDELITVYADVVPEISTEYSCIYHGDHGCALPCELRSQTCNDRAAPSGCCSASMLPALSDGCPRT